MEKELFGFLDTGTPVFRYTLKNEDATVRILTFGAIINEFTVFGKDIVGGFDKIEDYIADDSHQGGIIGRVANRIENARFIMDGQIYSLPKNNGENCLHGGVGFDRRIFDVESITDNSITLTYISADGEEGFPATLRTSVTYTLSGTALIIDYMAIPDGKTPIALTNHAYFNLNGFGTDVLSHTAEIYADRYTEVGENLIPNGNRPGVSGTAFDFLTPHKIGERIGGDFIGYDHNFILSGQKDEHGMRLGAKVSADDLFMEVYTDQPGLQFYIGNFLGGKPDFKGGVQRIRHGAFCLEAQTEPNCINSGDGFYEKGEVYKQRTVYKVGKVN